MNRRIATQNVAVVAHRGASGEFPENTRSAFEEAIRLGVETIEIDVHLARDKSMVILHDYSVDRTSDGHGDVSDMTLAEIKEFDAGAWFNPRFAGERFLTLEETLDLMPPRMRLNVHVKETEADREILVPKVVNELVRRSLLETAFLTGEESALRIARRTLPEIEICCFLSVPECVALNCRILQPGNGKVTSGMVAEAHRNGIEVNAFYADDHAEMHRLIDCGVDGILTNYPGRLQGLLGGAA